MAKKRIVIAIDGPAGVGKSSTAKALAERMGYSYIDTGAMYRAVTLKFLQEGIEISEKMDEKIVEKILKSLNIKIDTEKRQNVIYLDNIDVTERIRERDVTNNVSFIAKIPKVRDHLVYLQQQLGKKGGVILEGRDIGTAVFPNAELKIFLTATIEERAQRRFKELDDKSNELNMLEILEDIKRRDYKDSHREYNPLKKADDAILVDNTNMTLDQQVDYIFNLAQKVIKN
jgi:cytidylate kinase